VADLADDLTSVVNAIRTSHSNSINRDVCKSLVLGDVSTNDGENSSCAAKQATDVPHGGPPYFTRVRERIGPGSLAEDSRAEPGSELQRPEKPTLFLRLYPAPHWQAAGRPENETFC
jgi:hypothetical protein